MIYNFSREIGFRCIFEHICKIILRRKKHHNYIFVCRNYDSFNEIIKKYRLIIQDPKIINFLDINWGKCDIIEVKFVNEDNDNIVYNNNIEKIVNKIICYEVKSKFHKVQRNYYEFCESNYNFMENCKKYNIETFIISVIIFKDWDFSFNIYEYEKCSKRIYEYKKKKKPITN